MAREHKIDVGTIVEKECKRCKIVRPMRYDGFTIDEKDIELFRGLHVKEKCDKKQFEKLVASENYTCQYCRGTFAYQ